MKRSRGAALLAAMLTVTVVATLAAAALWQQWRTVEVESAERSRIQSGWILTGALDWARLILREDSPSVDHLGEPWAVPLQEARLSTFLAADQNNNAAAAEGEGDNIFLSGDITDLQSRLNVAGMVEAGAVKEERVETFRRLFELLGLPAAELDRLVENLRFAQDISVDNRNASRAPLPPKRVEQLVWLGLSPPTVAALEPFVTVLPTAESRVNINTAPPEVLYAVGRKIGLADAQRVVAQRERQHFRAVGEEYKLMPEGGGFATGTIAVASQFFEVRGRLRIDKIVIEERSIVQRSGRDVRTAYRERGAFEAAATVEPRR